LHLELRPILSAQLRRNSAAAKAVAEATKQLVEAARSATAQNQEQEAKPDWDGLGEHAQKKAELEAQARILKIQKDLDNATKNLADMRKKEYAEATGKTQNLNQSAPKQVVQPKAPVSKVPRVLPGEKYYSLEQLQARPPECDGARLEQYLSDADFIAAFSIDKATFAKQPNFKQTGAKRALGIF
jgi:thioester reductase-like protein